MQRDNQTFTCLYDDSDFFIATASVSLSPLTPCSEPAKSHKVIDPTDVVPVRQCLPLTLIFKIKWRTRTNSKEMY